jgi:hypothetical protein
MLLDDGLREVRSEIIIRVGDRKRSHRRGTIAFGELLQFLVLFFSQSTSFPQPHPKRGRNKVSSPGLGPMNNG